MEGRLAAIVFSEVKRQLSLRASCFREVNHPARIRPLPSPIETKEATERIFLPRGRRRHLSLRRDLARAPAEASLPLAGNLLGRARSFSSFFKMAARGVSRRVFEVFVRRIPWSVEENELRQYFTQFGPVKKCILPFNIETGFHKGFGWIGFAKEESRNTALLKDHFFEGSQLEVKRQEKTVR